MSKILLTFLILSVWVTFAVLHVGQYYKPPKEQVFLTLASEEQPGFRHYYYGIYLKDARIGYMRRSLMPDHGGYKIFEEALMKMSFLGEKKEIHLNLYSDVDEEFRMKKFSFQLSSGTDRMAVTGQMGEDNTLAVSLIMNGTRSSHSIPFKERPVIPAALVPLLVKSGFSKEKTMNISVFDPSAMTAYTADVDLVGWEKVNVEGEQVRAFHIKTAFKGIEVHGWVDEAGVMIKEVSPVGLSVVKEKEGKEADFLDVNLLASVETAGIAIERPRNASLVQMKITAPAHLLDILGRFYRLENGVTEIKRGELALLQLDPALYLSSSLFVSSDDKEIRLEARKILEKKESGSQKAEAVMRWVYGNMKKTPTFSLPVAKDVFIKRTGDCNEHAVLFAALARAANIPCAIASGMVYNNGRFYYHAWNLVHIDGRWNDVDSTFGQFPADATHIILAAGDISDGMEVMQFMKNVKIEILSVR